VSANKKFFAVMDPKSNMTVVYRVNADGLPSVHWTMRGWFEVAALADDGKHLIVGCGGGNLLPLSVTKDFPIIQFYKVGNRINVVTLGELLQDLSKLQRTVSHYRWGNYVGLDKDGRFVVQTVEGRRLAFDVTTGKLASIDTSPAEALKRAAAAAEAWLALLDEGKYADGWDGAAHGLKKRETKEDFEKSLRTLRKPWGKAESRELDWNNFMDAVTDTARDASFDYKTSFTGGRSADEMIFVTEEEGRWRVSRYEISEPPTEAKRRKVEAHAPKFRTWTDASRKQTLRAKFMSAAAGNVNLEKEDGTMVVLRIDQLSEEDREYLRQRRR
jgi:hypothetical protein